MITPTNSSQLGAAFLTASKIANSSSGIVIEARSSLRHHFFFAGGVGGSLIPLGPPGFEDEERNSTAGATFKAEMAPKMNSLKFFAAIEMALPWLLSLVASCTISENSTTQGLRIKIQPSIILSLRRQRSDSRGFRTRK